MKLKQPEVKGGLVAAAIEESALYLLFIAVAVPVVLSVARTVKWAGENGFGSIVTVSALASAHLLWGSFAHTTRRGAAGWAAAALIRLSAIAAVAALNAYLYHKLYPR